MMVADKKKAIENFRKSEQRRLNIQEFEGLVRNLNQTAKNINKQFINAYNAKLNKLQVNILNQIDRERQEGHSRNKLYKIVTTTSRPVIASFWKKKRNEEQKKKERLEKIENFTKRVKKRKVNQTVQKAKTLFKENPWRIPEGIIYRNAMKRFEKIRPNLSKQNGYLRS